MSMRKSIFTLAVMLVAALFVTTSCGNKSQKQVQEESQAGQVNNFRNQPLAVAVGAAR